MWLRLQIIREQIAFSGFNGYRAHEYVIFMEIKPRELNWSSFMIISGMGFCTLFYWTVLFQGSLHPLSDVSYFQDGSSLAVLGVPLFCSLKLTFFHKKPVLLLYKKAVLLLHICFSLISTKLTFLPTNRKEIIQGKPQACLSPNLETLLKNLISSHHNCLGQEQKWGEGIV